MASLLAVLLLVAAEGDEDVLFGTAVVGAFLVVGLCIATWVNTYKAYDVRLASDRDLPAEHP